ncbi:hypothetical protein TRFO_02942 [Tritrichomonas foetus]|uniref:Uncharacterized protein n=1 Tax=Tritrichomonas foetus TaxID=1144522 RepID=A0A1J4L0U4_9EUKA|nr:hypothetical protein TRFO_02942 [Tritrichomonas foetus]|eukprot:OHT15580.1 hypothetical protein TRFO_02942 [Tritrichomonas foetus]
MSKNKKIRLTGLTRETLCDLLEIYNKNITPESHSQSEAGSGDRITAATLKRIVSSFGINFSDEESRRAVISFSRGDALTFEDLVKFYQWFLSIKDILFQRTKQAFHNILSKELTEALPEENNILNTLKSIKSISESRLAGFIETDLEHFKSKFKDNFNNKFNISEFHDRIIADLNKLPKPSSSTRSSDNEKERCLKFDITLLNIFGLVPYEYIGIENDLPSLDVFIQLEFWDKVYKSAVFPARYSPSINQTFSFEIFIKYNLSFLDATWWVQTNGLKISVYAVHYLDNYVAYHLLGVANQPLVPLLIGKNVRTTFAINL